LVFSHYTETLSKNYSSNEILEAVHAVFDADKSWVNVSGNAKINKQYRKLGGLISDPVIAVNLVDNNDSWEIDIYASHVAVAERGGAPKRGSVVIKIKGQCVAAVQRFI
jgi:hypothetical protein